MRTARHVGLDKDDLLMEVGIEEVTQGCVWAGSVMPEKLFSEEPAFSTSITSQPDGNMYAFQLI